ncbi:MAG: Ger(x)C family spore germination protein [Bacillota bacterium]
MKRIVALLLIATCLFCTGCWDQIEITDLALVVATGIDKGDKPGQNVVLTIQVANPRALIPGETGGTKEAFWTATGRGESIREATYQTAHRIPRRVFFGHNRIMVVGEEVARSGILPYLDRYLRSRQTRANLYILVARGKAQRILETKMPTFQSSGMALINLFELGNNHAVVPVRLVQFVYDLISENSGAVAPIVQVVEQTSVSVEEKTERPLTLSVGNLAVFDTNGRMVGELGETETLGLLWIRDWMRRTEISVPCPISGPKEPVDLELVRSTSAIKVHMGEDGMPRYEIKVRVMVDVAEHFGSHPGLDRVWFLDSLEKRANTVIAQQIQSAVSKAQALNVDVFEFSEELRRQHPKEWQKLRDNWQDIFPMLEVTANIETLIGNRGMAAENPDARIKELK